MSGRGGPREAVPAPAVVLIAEDEEPVAETVAYVVEDAGYTPLVATHGQQALLVTDLMLPYLSGADLIAALRAEAATCGQIPPPTILITAASLSQARAAGADVVLRKPFHLAELEALLHRFLRVMAT